MINPPLRTTVVGSYTFPGWLEFASQHLFEFGAADIAEMQEHAVIAAIHDQVSAGLDVITDGEQTRLDFNLSFYGYLEGIKQQSTSPRKWGPPAHDQRGKHKARHGRSASDHSTLDSARSACRIASAVPSSAGSRASAEEASFSL